MMCYSCNYFPGLRGFIIVVLKICFGCSVLIKSVSKKEIGKTLEKEFRIHQDILHLIRMPNILHMLSSTVCHTQHRLSCSITTCSLSFKTFKHAQVCSDLKI